MDKSVDRLLKGKTCTILQCMHVDFRSTKQEEFIDLQLDVIGCKSVYDSLEAFCKVCPRHSPAPGASGPSSSGMDRLATACMQHSPHPPLPCCHPCCHPCSYGPVRGCFGGRRSEVPRAVPGALPGVFESH